MNWDGLWGAVASIPPASSVSFIPDGDIAATNVQAAIVEVRDDTDTKLTGKQPLDAGLTALAAYNTNGLLVQTANDTFAGRTLVAGSTKLAVTNGSGVAGNPSIDATEANFTLGNLGGTLGIAKGGTGQTTANPAFNALSPNTTKGDITVRNATVNVRQPVGTNGQYLVADSAQASGLLWRGLDVHSQMAAVITTTTSTTLVHLLSITTSGLVTKPYHIIFTGNFSHTVPGATISIQIYINGVVVFFGLGLRTCTAPSVAGANFMMSTNWTQSVPVGQLIEIRWSTTSGTASCVRGGLSILGVG